MNGMKKMFVILCVTAVLLLFTTELHADGGKITAFCGAASKPALEEAARIFEKRTAIKVELYWGGSGTMLSQMKLSRKGDLFIPGSPDYMIKAQQEGIIDPATVSIIAYLIPAINVQRGNPRNIRKLSDLAQPGLRVALGNPESVCVGLYATEVLSFNRLLKAVEKNLVTLSPSCSATASLVAMKKVDAVIGWDVFAKWNPDEIETIFLKPAEVPRLAYIPAAITRNFCKNRAGAEAFLRFLSSPEGRSVFARWGYVVTEADARKYAPNAKIGGEYILPENGKFSISREQGR